MPHRTVRWLPAALVLVGIFTMGGGATGDDFQPTGRWVLVKDWGWPSEWAIIDVGAAGTAYDVRLIDARRNLLLRQVHVKNFVCRDGHVAFELSGEQTKLNFDGALAADGPYAGQFVGTIRGQYLDPARLQRTTAEKVAAPERPPYNEQIKAAYHEKGKVTARLMDVVRQHPGPETSYEFRQVLAAAESADLSEEQVRDLLRGWFSHAELYGKTFLGESRLVVLRSLRGQKRFASIALEVAEQGRTRLADLTSGLGQSSLLHFLAEAAELSGHSELAAAAASQAEEMDTQLDAEYRAHVPPFAVDAYAGRKSAETDRVVLLELFTGAACAPCVAADVACEALHAVFKPSELILLEHHLHIAGADPLANPDTIARAEYYGIRGIPTAIFNGEEDPTGGGDMAASEAKYQEYRQRIEALLAEKRLADIELKLSRAADVLTIHAVAGVANASDAADRAAASRDLRLRLVLTEELVRYAGPNGVLFNRAVVRDFPGGLEGKQFSDGQAKIDLALNVADVRERLNSYLRGKSQALAVQCPQPVPKLSLEQLAVVAFVQDDATKRVLHAVKVAVPQR